MATERLEQISYFSNTDEVSVPRNGADFYFQDDGHSTGTLDVVLDRSNGLARDGIDLTAVYGLQDYLKTHLRHHQDAHVRRQNARCNAIIMHQELEVDDSRLTLSEKSSLVASRLYLSNIVALASLGEFISTMRWTGKKSEESMRSKSRYLEDRGLVQEDMDDYLDRFANQPPAVRNQALLDVANMGRLLISNKEFINSNDDTNTHIFMGSLLSERLVKVSLQRRINPETRYSTAEEDASPTKADVVLPTEEGDIHLQVKMKWKKPTEMKIKPKKKPAHIIIPMMSIRDNLTKGEHKQLKQFIREQTPQVA